MLPFYSPPAIAERLRLETERQYSERKGRAEKAKPMNVGLWDELKRQQIDLLDLLASQKGA